ncbi:MAG: flavodoxin-dependent (E)-4-hydroxy-3-methylbut-2-enyl-diphosphate synthase, partial [Gemmatimonadetes bacterium]|nr:flavodoxin-dependent (E)-4-hydroxy-3-methylbut-2-enyl-diphosphate synthase [Gemmatimonadota bacterium]
MVRGGPWPTARGGQPVRGTAVPPAVSNVVLVPVTGPGRFFLPPRSTIPGVFVKPVQRRKSLAVNVDGVVIGGDAPVVVQSMTNTDTADVESTFDQVRLLADAGSELVRVTVNNDDAAQALPEIVSRLRAHGYTTPIVGDFHYNGHLLLTRYPEAARALAKLRINPGNVGTKHRDANFTKIIEVALEYDKPIRIGVNWGSLDQRLLTELMDENAARDEPM